MKFSFSSKFALRNPWPQLTVVVIVLVGLIGGVGLLGSTGPAGASPPPAWNVLTAFSQPQIPLVVSCPTSMDCVAVGLNNPDNGDSGSIVTTSNGGETWTPRNVPSGAAGLTGVSCPSTSICFAVGDGGHVVKSVNGGATWTLDFTTKAFLAGISCGSTERCVAIGDNSTLRTIDGGAKWSARKFRRSSTTTETFYGVSCLASTLDCVIVGQGTTRSNGSVHGVAYTTSNQGAKWRPASVPSDVSLLRSASCESTTQCVAVGFGATLTSSNGGATWADHPQPSGTGPLFGLSCASTSDCVAVGGDQAASTTDGGTTWSSVDLPVGDSGNSVACVSPAVCIAVGPSASGTFVTSDDGGSTWTNEDPPGGLGLLTDITCPSASACVATDGVHLLTTTDGGTTWVDGTVPAGDDGFGGIACSSTSHCIAVSGNAYVMTSDGGATWTDDTPSGGAGGSGISCGSATHCVVVGGFGIEVTDDGGTTWSSATAPGRPLLNAVSCVSASDCVAAGLGGANNDAIVSTDDGGTTWTSDNVVTGSAVLFGVSCPSTEVCNVVGVNQVFTTSDGGTTWHEQALSGAFGVSCSSPADCVSVGSGAIFTTLDGGTTWTSTPVPNGVSVLKTVSCYSTTQCVAVGVNSQNGGIVIGFNDPAVALTSSTSTATATPSATTAGSPVSYSASVAAAVGSGTPSGTVTFTIGTAWICTAALSGGSGSCTDATAIPGLDTVTAVYSGDATFASSSTTTTVRVNSGVACASLSGSAGGSISLKSCTPTAPTLKSASAPASVLTSGGTLTWAKRGQTTVVSLSSSSPGRGSCVTGSTQRNVTGTVTGGTSTATVVGDLVNLWVCQTASGALSLVPVTTATL